MAWKIEFEKPARKEFLKLGYPTQKKIVKYLSSKVAINPKQYGKSLSGNLSGLWRYRVDGFRIICRIEDHTLTVVVLRVAHRSRVYQQH